MAATIATELEIDLRLLLDAAMTQKRDITGYTVGERTRLHSRRMGTSKHDPDPVGRALAAFFQRTSEELSKHVTDEKAINEIFGRLCHRGPGGFWQRFYFCDEHFCHPMDTSEEKAA